VFELPHAEAHELCMLKRRAFVPFASDPALTVNDIDFAGFGFPGNAAAPGQFNRGWTVTVPDSKLRDLVAMFTGMLRLEPAGSAGGPVTVALTLADPVAEGALRHLRPEWLPLPATVRYRNVDRSSLMQAVHGFADRDPAIVDKAVGWARENGVELGSAHDWTTVVDGFFAAGTLPVPVMAGWPLGRSAASPTASGKFELGIGIRDETDSLDLNPSWYLARHLDVFDVLEHSLSQTLLNVGWGPFAGATFRFVKKGSTPSGGFTSPATASPSLAPAVAACGANDTVVILDSETYAEPQLTIDKPITISGFESAATPARPPTDATFHATTTSFPKLDGADTHRVLFVKSWAAAANTTPACVRNVVVKRGRVAESPGSSSYQGGAGMAIEGQDRIVVENCAFVDNKTRWSMKSINAYDLLTSDVKSFLDNPTVATDAQRAKVADLKARLMNVKDFGLAGQSFGGGVNCLQSSPYLRGNLFDHNEAMARGGAVGVCFYAWPVIEGNRMIGNSSTNAGAEGRPDGGAVGITVSVPSKSKLLTIGELITDFVTWLGSKSKADRAAMLLAAAFDESKLMRDFLEQPRRDQLWDPKLLAAARRRAVVLVGNDIRSNTAYDDGGGVYASIMSGVYMRGNTIRENKTEKGAGGGLRATMACQVRVVDDKIERNTCFSHTGAEKNDKNGGGGVSARDAELELLGTTAIRDANLCRGWAGGGIFFSSSHEGGTLQLFHVIMWEIFGFRKSSLVLAPTAVVEDNETRYQPEHDPVHKPPQDPTAHHHAKGGGLYVLRAKVEDGEVPHLAVSIASGKVTGNRARQKVGTTVVDVVGENKTNFYLHDEKGGEEKLDSDYAASTGAFTYTTE
jgi:hypothetical protein